MDGVSDRSLELAVIALESEAQACQSGATLMQRGIDPLAREYLVAAAEVDRVLAERQNTGGRSR